MHRSLVAAVLLAALLGRPAAPAAQVVPPPADQGPIIGLYTDPDVMGDAAAWLEVDGYPAVIEMHAVLSHPGVDALGALEMQIKFSPRFEAAIDGVYLWNGSPVWDWWYSWPDIAIAWPEPAPVADGHAWVMGMQLLISAPVVDGGIFLVPSGAPSVPGEMAFVGADDPLDIIVMRPNSDGLVHDQPVFRVNPDVVAVETTSFSAIKALFGRPLDAGLPGRLP